MKQKRKVLNQYKLEKGCVDCGYKLYPEALDLDHRPDEEKVFTVSQGLNRKDEDILAEIAKCDVVCANCHRIRTQKRRTVFNPQSANKFETKNEHPTLWGTT